MSEMCQLSINISSDIAEELMSHLWLIPEIVTGCTCIPAQGLAAANIIATFKKNSGCN
jgi:hypothetical protein